MWNRLISTAPIKTGMMSVTGRKIKSSLHIFISHGLQKNVYMIGRNGSTQSEPRTSLFDSICRVFLKSFISSLLLENSTKQLCVLREKTSRHLMTFDWVNIIIVSPLQSYL